MQRQPWTRSGRSSKKVSSLANDQGKVQESGYSGSTKRHNSQFFCHLKNAELEPKYQKYKGWVVLRGDIVKDDAGSYAVFTELGFVCISNNGSNCSGCHCQDTRCAGQAADAVSAHTQVLQKCSNFQSQNVQIFGVRFPRHRWPKSLSNIEDPVVLLDGHSLAGFLWDRQFGKGSSGTGTGKVPNWEFLFVFRKHGLFLSVYVDDMNMVGRKQNSIPCGKFEVG